MKSTAMAFAVTVLVVGMLSTIGTSLEQTWNSETWNFETSRSFKQCEAISDKIATEDRGTVVEDNSTLHSTWLSQECEVRAGPEYIIRKYTFFENGTFLLLRYHYDDMSCSMPTHTVSIWGSIKLLGPSSDVSGATETKVHMDAVYITPLNKQVARKFEQRMNLTCGPQPRWRPYVSQLIYEQLRQHSATQPWHSPFSYNTLQARSKKRLRQDCLDAFKIGVDELKLLRVQRRLFLSKSSGSSFYREFRWELLLGSPAPNVAVRRTYKATSLQSTSLIHVNTMKFCLICSSVSRSTELNPPLLLVVVPLPAVIGGYWLSERCESSENGIWSKRRFQIYAGDKLWSGWWEYYEDPQCMMFLYAATAAGSYIQRKQHEELDGKTFASAHFHPLNNSARFFKRSVSDPYRSDLMNASALRTSAEESSMRINTYMEMLRTQDKKTKRPKKKRSLTDNVNQLLHDAQISSVQSRFAAMLRGHQAYETTSKRPAILDVLSGTTELDMHIAISALIPGAAAVANRCEAEWADMPLTSWPRNCVPRAIEAPSTMRLRARMGVNWNGQYILLLGLRDDNVWKAPLRQCAEIPLYNPILKAHLRRSVDLRFGLLSAAPANRASVWLLVSQLILCCLLYRAR